MENLPEYDPPNSFLATSLTECDDDDNDGSARREVYWLLRHLAVTWG